MPTKRAATPAPDTLDLRYIPLADASRWDENPKKHDIDALIQSIELHGFGDPPKFDAKLGALTYGNGRVEALERMRAEGRPAPRGIAVDGDGEWAIPMILGLDAQSKAAAIAFAVDHNNLTLLGGELGFIDMLAMWDEEGLQGVLQGVPDASNLLASLDEEDVAALLVGPEFEPVRADDQSQLDEKATTTCPECGHEFAP